MRYSTDKFLNLYNDASSGDFDLFPVAKAIRVEAEITFDSYNWDYANNPREWSLEIQSNGRTVASTGLGDGVTTPAVHADVFLEDADLIRPHLGWAVYVNGEPFQSPSDLGESVSLTVTYEI